MYVPSTIYLHLSNSLHGIGYKQRSKISAGLKKHSKVVNAVLNEYNNQAKWLGQPVLDFQQVTEYTFLSNFELLHSTHNDITEQPWACPLICNAMTSWMKINHAKEEINHLNIEAQRLKTYIWDSSLAQWNVIQHLCQTDPALAAELQECHEAQSTTNTLLSQQLCKVELLPSFSGWTMPGMQAGGNYVDPGSESNEGGVDEGDHLEHEITVDAAVDDETGDQLFCLDNLCPDAIQIDI